jgi:recombination protein RecT
VSTALTKTSKDKITTFADTLSGRKKWLEQVLPKHVKADRFVKVAVAALTRQPELLECDQNTVILSILQAGQLGLEPTGVLGSAYLVKYGNRAQLIIGYRGLIDLARRSGQILSIEAHAVHAKDKFTCWFGLDPVLKHEPCWDDDPGALTHVYAVAKLRDGGSQFDVMSKAQVDKIKATSKSGSRGPWVDHYEEMAKKTVIRRISKYLPLTVEMQTAAAVDDSADTGAPFIDAEVIEAASEAEIVVEAKPAQTRAAALTATVVGKVTPADDPPYEDPPPPGTPY